MSCESQRLLHVILRSATSTRQLKTGMKERTGGQVNMKMYYGGIAGDEITVVRKMRVGQLDGALITSTGLSALVRQVLVMEAPGLIRSYPELDAVREDLAPQLEALFDQAGYKLIAWGDAGKTRIFSTQKIYGPFRFAKRSAVGLA